MDAPAPWVIVAAMVFIIAAFNPASAQEAPTVFYFEGGVDFSHFTDGYGDGNGQWLVFILSQPANYSLRFDLSRVDRWGDEGVGDGILAQKFIDRLTLGAGASGGSGDFIYPEYRVDASVGYGFLAEGNLQIILGYLHEQSKAENSYDRMAVWFTWQKRYIGGQFSYGDVNYTQISDVDFLVAFENFSVRLYYSEYFNPTFGTNIKFDYGTNKYFDVYGISASLFKSW
jgi:hypothetical protein